MLIREMWHNDGSDYSVVDNLRGVKRFIDSDESLDEEGKTHESSTRSIFRLADYSRRAPLFHLSLPLSFSPSSSLPRRFTRRNSSSSSRLDSRALCVSSHHQPSTMTILALMYVEGSGCQSVRAIALRLGITWLFVAPDCKSNRDNA